jgi:DHA1 family bicyclomycin/chloramphenicol resistance-like MFS transporter
VVMGAALVLVCALLLPETHPPEKRSRFHVGELAHTCWRIAIQPSFLLLALSAAFAIASLFIYIGSAPAIILERWRLSETQFHYIFIPVVLGFMVSAIMGNRLAGRVSRTKLLRIGFGLLCAAGGVGVLAHQLADQVPIPVVQVLLFIMALGAQMTYPVLSLEMIDMHPRARGAAASVQSFIALGIGALVMGMVAPILHGNLRLLAWISLGLGLSAWIAWRAGVTLQKRTTRA